MKSILLFHPFRSRRYELHLGEKDSFNQYVMYQHKRKEQEVHCKHYDFFYKTGTTYGITGLKFKIPNTHVSVFATYDS